MKRYLGKIIHNIQSKLISYGILLSARSSFMANIYYCFFSSAFIEEHKSVASGINSYYHEERVSEGTSVMLRRNIHRLEKGLIMRPRRKQFALEYIYETVNEYSQLAAFCNKKGQVNCEELKWAHDVLSEYFLNVESCNAIDKAKALFLMQPKVKTDSISIPYIKGAKLEPSVSYDQFLSLSIQRRSVRWYLKKMVPRELVDKAIKAALLTPSACNRQPFKYYLFDDPELIRIVGKIPMGSKGFFENFPGIIVLTGKLNYFSEERDRHVIYIDASLSAMAFMYALETLGVSSCVINWPNIITKENQIRKLLNLKVDERVILMMSYGYADPEGMIPFSQKKPLDLIRSYNEIDK